MIQEKNNKMKNKTLIAILGLMILWDFSLHLQELIGIPFYLNFSTRLTYTIFWTIFWFIGSSLIITIWSKTK